MRIPRILRTFAACGLLAAAGLVHDAAPALAQSAEGQPPAVNGGDPPRVNPDRLPIDIDKIQRAVTRPPAIRLETTRSVFRVEIFGRKPTIEDILGKDFLRGPVPAGSGMTHQEFLNMVTPRDVQGYAAFSNKEGLAVAATTVVLQWAVQKAIQKYQDAKEDRAREAARREVEEALAELRRARRAAGLTDQ
jgi:hypothetical protein